MSSELLYTSAPKGLRHGSRGFCVVLTTAGMPINVISRLEAISSYRRLFAPDSGHDDENPVAYAHQRLNLAGSQTSVLSRVAAYGTDYSGRPNKLAHHILLDSTEYAAAGPAWLMLQSLMRRDWFGQCETPSSGPEIPRGDQNARICSAWKSVYNDAGWGGVVAEEMLSGDTQPLWIIYPVEHRDVLLALMNESISLIPPEQRWRATFNTYAANIPPDVICKIRCVPAGGEEAKFAASSGRVIDLTRSQSITSASHLVSLARGIRESTVSTIDGGGCLDVLEGQHGASQWSSPPPVAPPPAEGPPELPPELVAKPKDRTLLIAGCVLAAVFGLAGTWVVARQMAGLPINPLAEAPPPQITPRPIIEPEPAPVVAPDVSVPMEQVTLQIKYDQKQMLALAKESVESEIDLNGPIEMRGKIRLVDTIKTEDASEFRRAEERREKAVKASQLISWGGEAFALGEPTDLSIQSTKLTASSGVFRVEPFPRSAPGLEYAMKMYWSRDTDDLVALVGFDWSNPTSPFEAQAESYRSVAVEIGDMARLYFAIKQNASALPDSYSSPLAPVLAIAGRGEEAVYRQILRSMSSTESFATEARAAGETIRNRARNSPEPLQKEVTDSLFQIQADLERLAAVAQSLQDSFKVLEAGQTVEVPELKFYDSEGAVVRRIPLRIHFSW
ncbi:MAG: hypothetical protein AAFX06_17790 [Planctomycetota bacterium]